MALPAGYDFDRSLRYLSFGQDPGFRRVPGEVWKAAHTPAGPASLRLERRPDGVQARAWGAGASWLLERLPDLLGLHDAPAAFSAGAGRLGALVRRGRGVHLPRLPWVLDGLAGVILQQRVAYRDAVLARRRLIARFGAEAPGPAGLRLPLGPRQWLALPSDDFRRAGVDGQRERCLRAAARQARRLEATAADRAAARALLAAIPGCGPWTVEMTMAWVLGDPDAVPVGDLHLPKLVAWALAGETRAGDARLLELLEPYRPHRFRLLRLLVEAGAGPPGPGHGRMR